MTSEEIELDGMGICPEHGRVTIGTDAKGARWCVMACNLCLRAQGLTFQSKKSEGRLIGISNL